MDSRGERKGDRDLESQVLRREGWGTRILGSGKRGTRDLDSSAFESKASDLASKNTECAVKFEFQINN